MKIIQLGAPHVSKKIQSRLFEGHPPFQRLQSPKKQESDFSGIYRNDTVKVVYEPIK